MTMIVIYLIILLILLSYIYSLRMFSYWKTRNVPGPKPIPIFGNLKRSALREVNAGHIYKEIYDQYPNSKVVGIYRMTKPALLIRDLDVIKDILIKDFQYFPERGIVFRKQGLIDNLFHCNADVWKEIKNKITPLFTTSKLKSMVPAIVDRTDKLIEYLIGNKEEQQELQKLFRRFMMSVSMAAFFDIEVDTVDEKGKMFDEMDKSIFGISPFNEATIMFPKLSLSSNMTFSCDSVFKFSLDVVKNAINERQKAKRCRSNAIDYLLDIKEEKQNKPTNEEKLGLRITDELIASQVFVLYAATYENPGVCLAFALHHLANNIEVKDKLLKEIDESLLKYNGAITYQSISEMKYLEKIFLETLRLNPLTNGIQRKALKDYDVPGTNVRIPKGMTVIISALAIQRDEKHYPNPDKFDPERFSIENAKERHSCAYLPFGVGPRSCIGIRLSKIVFQIAIIKILSKFNVSATGENNLEEIDPYRVTVACKRGIYLKFTPRKDVCNEK